MLKYPTNTVVQIVLCCEVFITLFTQMIHNKHTKMKRAFLISRFSTWRSTAVRDVGWHTGLNLVNGVRRVMRGQ